MGKLCPFLEKSFWEYSGYVCSTKMGKENKEIYYRNNKYCGYNIFSEDYKNCPLYKDEMQR